MCVYCLLGYQNIIKYCCSIIDSSIDYFVLNIWLTKKTIAVVQLLYSIFIQSIAKNLLLLSVIQFLHLLVYYIIFSSRQIFCCCSVQ